MSQAVMSQAVTTPPQESTAPLVALDPHIQESEDSDAWEYEYSNTETETYYVTLDLTTPNVEPRRRPTNPTRTDPKGKWKNHGIASQRRERPFSPKSYRYTEGREDNPTATPAADPENSQMNDKGNSTRGSPQDGPSLKAKEEEDQDSEQDGPRRKRARPDPVQILNLHSATPMVSYRGQVFSCEWASNSGTELLFIHHDDDNQLPILRSLPGGVDLLAASSCRLVPKAVTLEPKFHARNRMASDLQPRRHAESGSLPISIPVGPGASQKRKDQAKFLEGLMAIKEEKGEEDEITVIAQKRQLNNKWKIVWNKKRQADRSKLMELIRDKAQIPACWEEVEHAKRRIQEMDHEDGTESGLPRMTGGGYESMAYKSGRKRKSSPGTADGLGRGPIVNRDIAGVATPTISSPAPLRWVDAETGEYLDSHVEYQEDADKQDLGGTEGDQGLYDEDDLESELYY